MPCVADMDAIMESEATLVSILAFSENDGEQGNDILSGIKGSNPPIPVVAGLLMSCANVRANAEMGGKEQFFTC